MLSDGDEGRTQNACYYLATLPCMRMPSTSAEWRYKENVQTQRFTKLHYSLFNINVRTDK